MTVAMPTSGTPLVKMSTVKGWVQSATSNKKGTVYVCRYYTIVHGVGLLAIEATADHGVSGHAVGIEEYPTVRAGQARGARGRLRVAHLGCNGSWFSRTLQKRQLQNNVPELVMPT